MNILDVNSKEKIIDKMIVIGGSARSGTTIMGKLINSMKNVEYFFEPPILTSLLLKKDELSNRSLIELLQFYFFDDFLLNSLSGRYINLNKNDDSCIYFVKNDEDIKNRISKSFGRIEINEIVKKYHFSFKLPEIVFFIDTLNELFPSNTKVFMHRNPNDTINSLLNKRWFSNKFLHTNHPSEIYSTRIIRDMKIPYWVEVKDESFWLDASDIQRCGYYYKRISESILKNKDDLILVNYDDLIMNTQYLIEKLSNRLNLIQTEMTQKIVSNVKYQSKKRVYLLDELDNNYKFDILNIDEELRKFCI